MFHKYNNEEKLQNAKMLALEFKTFIQEETVVNTVSVKVGFAWKMFVRVNSKIKLVQHTQTVPTDFFVVE